MLDPKEMKKGGFGASAELARQRREDREKAAPNGTAPLPAPTPAAAETDTPADPDAPSRKPDAL
ncbi:MAG TPA: hypothetical protein VJ672_13375 [Gemmatimonadaceae bacterium]|nr:hypothetical protein [Gemmatimonadaceae bacterium]